MKLFKEFQPVTKDQWLDKVTADLKGKKEIAELSQAEIGSEVISPFYHGDDVIDDIDIPISSLPETLLGNELTIIDPIKGNELIIEVLEGGVSFLYLKMKGKTPDYNILFNGVLLDLIYVVVQVEEEESRRLCKGYVQNHYKKPLPHFSIINEDFTFVHSDESIESALQHLLEKGRLSLSQGVIENPFYFQLPLGHNYIENICAIQASRLLWANLLEAHGLGHDEHDLLILCFVPFDILSSDQHDNMISLAQIAMSMMSGGADIIMLPPSDVLKRKEGSEDTRRISRNIYNLMTMESHMNKVQSPSAGSYLFDKASSDLARRSWNHFIKKSES